MKDMAFRLDMLSMDRDLINIVKIMNVIQCCGMLLLSG